MKRTQPLAVVVPSEESDLRAADRASLHDFLPPSVRIAHSSETQGVEPAEGPAARDLTRLLLLLVLTLLVGETLFAWFLDQKRNL